MKEFEEIAEYLSQIKKVVATLDDGNDKESTLRVKKSNKKFDKWILCLKNSNKFLHANRSSETEAKK